jgi:hypothetical protein
MAIQSDLDYNQTKTVFIIIITILFFWIKKSVEEEIFLSMFE